MDLIVNYVSHIIGNIFVVLFIFTCWENCIKGKKFLDNNKKVLLIIGTSFIVSIINLYVNQPFRIIMVYLFMILIATLFYAKKIFHSAFLVIITELSISIIEVSFVIIMSFLYQGDIEKIVAKPIVFIIISAYVSILGLFIIKTGIYEKLYNLFCKVSFFLKSNELFQSIIFIFILIILPMVESYMNLSLSFVLTINVIIGLIIMFIVIKHFFVKADFNKISNKYETSVVSLREYWKMIVEYRIDRHENKNQFLIIRNMINDKKVKKYIDELLNEKTNESFNNIDLIVKIPDGALRAIIHSKLSKMEDYDIKYSLNVSSDLQVVDLINLDDSIVLSICKILGVFLDNSIEATKDINFGKIKIDIYLVNNYLYIDVINNYVGEIDINKIGNSRYTTKGKVHGYGLILVKKLVSSSSSRLENDTTVNGNEFTQTLKIKM